jgi:hypothetical protein
MLEVLFKILLKTYRLARRSDKSATVVPFVKTNVAFENLIERASEHIYQEFESQR